MSMESKKDNKDYIYSGILLFLLSAPFFMWPILKYFALKSVLVLIIGVLFYKNQGRKNKALSNLFFIYVISIVIYSLTSPFPIIMKFLSFLSFAPLAFIPFAKEEFTKKTYFIFEYIYVAFLSLSILSWIGHLLGVVPLMGQINGLISELGNNAYDVYFLCVKQNVYDSIRFYGPYDEPGVIGTYSAIMLVIRKFDLKSWKNKILLLSGLLALSLFFFIIIGGYLLYAAISHRRFFPIFVLLLLIPIVYAYTKDEVEFQYRVWNRFIIEDGKWAGDDRSSEYLDNFYESKKFTIEYWIGINDWDKFASRMEGESTYKNVVLRNGMIFFSLYCWFFIKYGYTFIRKRLVFLLYLFVLLGCLYQRTNVYGALTLFLFVMLAKEYSLYKISELKK